MGFLGLLGRLLFGGKGGGGGGCGGGGCGGGDGGDGGGCADGSCTAALNPFQPGGACSGAGDMRAAAGRMCRGGSCGLPQLTFEDRSANV